MSINRLGNILFRLVAATVAPVLAHAADFKQPEPLAPQVLPASTEASESMAGIRIPTGWQIELFAAEPDVANIVAFDIDNRGRFFVCESYRQDRGVTDNRNHDQQWLLADLAAETVQDRIDYHKRLLGDAAVTYAQHDDRIRRIEDLDGDGKADRSVVLANGFNRLEDGTGAGVLARGGTVYYTCIPKLWKLIDTDDDGRADERVVMSDGYGVRVSFRGHDMHGLVVGPDGRLYFSIGDRGYNVTTEDGRVLADPQSGAVFRCELDGTGLEVFATGMRNPQELAFNDVGDLFSVDNNSDSGDKARVIEILEGGDSGWRMPYQYLADRGPFNREKLWETYHPEQPAYLVPPIAHLTDGPSGLTFYPGTGFGDELKDQFLICDFGGGPANSGIRSFRLEPDGAFYKMGEHSDLIWTVLATDVAFGPDGAIYISDWVDGWVGVGKGRIYRLTDPRNRDQKAAKAVMKLLASDWATKDTDKLASLLAHADRRVRFEAQWELASRGDAGPLISLATAFPTPSTARLHAIWGADQIARTDEAQRDTVLAKLRILLDDGDTELRAAAAKVAGDRGDLAASAKLRALLADESARVRYCAATSLGKLKDLTAFASIVELLEKNDNADPALRHAGIRYLATTITAEKICELKNHPNESVRRAAVVALRRMRSGELSKFLKDDSKLVVLEAARAIYDVPVPVALQSLAMMIDQPLGDHNLLQRILNANYCLGTADAAGRLAEFAGRVSAPPEMRIEALDELKHWVRPDSRDRVTGKYRVLHTRPVAQATDALSPQIDILMSSQESVREKAIEVASSLGMKKIAPLLSKRVVDQSQRSSIRASSLVALARLDRAQAVMLAQDVKLVPANELVVAALKILSEFDAQHSLPKFIEATQSHNVDVRQLAWDILGTSKETEALATIVGGVESYLDGSLSSDVHLNVLEAAKGKLDEKRQEALIEHDRELAESDELGPWLISLNGGDASRGKKIFMEKTELSCVRCHRVDRVGGEVGPNLTVIGKEKDRRYLLESICLPNAEIAKGFETAVIANDDGQVFTGIVKSEDDDFIDLIQNDGSQVRIATEQIVVRRKGRSSMPEDLIKLMNARQLRDLVAYLASLQVDPRTASDTE